jgi:hypothetical protein
MEWTNSDEFQSRYLAGDCREPEDTPIHASTWGRKLKLAYQLALPLMPAEVRRELMALMDPVMWTVFVAILAVATWLGGGVVVTVGAVSLTLPEFAGGVLLSYGISSGACQWAQEFCQYWRLAVGAKSEEELKQAAQHLARAAGIAGANGVFFGLLAALGGAARAAKGAPDWLVRLYRRAGVEDKLGALPKAGEAARPLEPTPTQARGAQVPGQPRDLTHYAQRTDSLTGPLHRWAPESVELVRQQYPGQQVVFFAEEMGKRRQASPAPPLAKPVAVPEWQFQQYYEKPIREYASQLNPAKTADQLVMEAKALRTSDHLTLASGRDLTNYSRSGEARQFVRSYLAERPQATLSEAFDAFESRLRKTLGVLPFDVTRPFYNRDYFERYANDPATTKALIEKFFPYPNPAEFAREAASRVGERFLPLFTHPEIYRTRRESLGFIERYLQSHPGAHPFEVFRALEESWGYETYYRAMWLTEGDAGQIRAQGLLAPGLRSGDGAIVRMYDPNDIISRDVFNAQNRDRVGANGTAIPLIYNSFTKYPELGASIAYWQSISVRATSFGGLQAVLVEEEARRAAAGLKLYLVEARVPRLNAPAAMERPGGDHVEWGAGERTYAFNDPENERLILFNIPARPHPEGGGNIVSVRPYEGRPPMFNKSEARDHAYQGQIPQVRINGDRMGRLADALRNGETLATLQLDSPITAAQRAQLERAATDVLRGTLQATGDGEGALARAVTARQEWLERQGFRSWGGDFNARAFGPHSQPGPEIVAAQNKALRYLAEQGQDQGLRDLATQRLGR